MNASVQTKGLVSARVIRAKKAPLSWRLKNLFTPGFIWGWIANHAALLFTQIFGVPTLISELAARYISADGEVIDYGVVCRRLVTQAGTQFLVDDWVAGTTEIADMKFHASGTGTTAAANTDTALETEATSVTDRATGSLAEESANQVKTIGTQSFTGSAAITEHGLFSVITESSGVLWDRHTFSAINVGNGDSIEWTYTLTVAAET